MLFCCQFVLLLYRRRHVDRKPLVAQPGGSKAALCKGGSRAAICAHIREAHLQGGGGAYNPHAAGSHPNMPAAGSNPKVHAGGSQQSVRSGGPPRPRATLPAASGEHAGMVVVHNVSAGNQTPRGRKQWLSRGGSVQELSLMSNAL